MQNAKSYEDLKAELGNSRDWGWITAVSMGQADGSCSGHLIMIKPVGAKRTPEKMPVSCVFLPTVSPHTSWKFFLLLHFIVSSCFVFSVP